MIYQVDHVTAVDYDDPVSLARFNLRLRPTAIHGQHSSDFTISIDPAPLSLVSHPGIFPVQTTRATIDGPFDSLTIRTRFVAEVDDARLDLDPYRLSVSDAAAAALETGGLGPWAPANYLYYSPLLPPNTEIEQWARQRLDPSRDLMEAALDFSREIQRDFSYDPDATEADTPVAEAFKIRSGVCQDFAHILIAAFRAAGLPAGYASGYLRTMPPPGRERLIGVDAMHAWTMLWCGRERGWIGFDPTNGCVAGPDHIFAAMGRDYSDVAPIDGIFIGGGKQHLKTAVDVVPIVQGSG